MLVDENVVRSAEAMLTASGKLEDFIQENGPVQGRMMVTLGEPPEGSDIEVDAGQVTFIGSSDGVDCALGIVFDPVAHAPASGMWVVRQSEEASPPSQQMVATFAEKLMAAIAEDGTVDVPVISFIAENSRDLTIVGFKG